MDGNKRKSNSNTKWAFSSKKMHKAKEQVYTREIVKMQVNKKQQHRRRAQGNWNKRLKLTDFKHDYFKLWTIALKQCEAMKQKLMIMN